jgi:hypothetical protein
MATKIEFLEATVAELTKDNNGIKQVLDLKQNERFKVEAKVNSPKSKPPVQYILKISSQHSRMKDRARVVSK